MYKHWHISKLYTFSCRIQNQDDTDGQEGIEPRRMVISITNWHDMKKWTGRLIRKVTQVGTTVILSRKAQIVDHSKVLMFHWLNFRMAK